MVDGHILSLGLVRFNPSLGGWCVHCRRWWSTTMVTCALYWCCGSPPSPSLPSRPSRTSRTLPEPSRSRLGDLLINGFVNL